MDKKRISYLDVMKAFGILYVLIYHIYNNVFITGWLNRFQLPVFLFAAGVLYKDTTMVGFAKKKTTQIIVPYLLWGGGTLSYYFLIERHFRNLDLSLADCIVKGLLLGEQKYLDFNSPLWFLPCFFLTQIGYVLLYKAVRETTKAKSIRVGVCIAVSLVVYCAYRLLELDIELYNINIIPKFMLFYSLGVAWKEQSRFKCKKIYTGILSILGFVISGVCYYWSLQDLFVCIFGVAGTLFLSILISHNSIIEFVGRKTLTIMAVHGPVYRIITYLLGKLLKQSPDYVRGNITCVTIIVLVTLCVCIAIDLIIRKLINLVYKYWRT